MGRELLFVLAEGELGDECFGGAESELYDLLGIVVDDCGIVLFLVSAVDVGQHVLAVLVADEERFFFEEADEA